MSTQAALLEALKPCPFCGNRPTLTVRPNNAEASEYFAAVSCFCGGYSACAHKMATAPEAADAEAMVRAAWNGRAADAAQPEPVAWLRDQRGEYEGPATLEPLFLLGASQPALGARYGKATYSPLYAAPQEPAK